MDKYEKMILRDYVDNRYSEYIDAAHETPFFTEHSDDGALNSNEYYVFKNAERAWIMVSKRMDYLNLVERVLKTLEALEYEESRKDDE